MSLGRGRELIDRPDNVQRTTCLFLIASPRPTRLALLTASARFTLPISRRFIEIGLGLDINEFSTKFEAFAVSGLCGVPKTDNDRRSLLKAHIRNAVRHGLRKYQHICRRTTNAIFCRSYHRPE